MDIKIETENTFNICTLIHNITKLNVEFIDNSVKPSFRLFSSQIPVSYESYSAQTTSFIHNFLKDKKPNKFFYHIDNFQLSYLGVGLWENIVYKGTIIVGPFLSNIPDDALISSVIEINKLSLGNRLLLDQYYKTLTILDIDDHKNIGNFMVNLSVNSFTQGDELLSENSNPIIYEKANNKLVDEKFYPDIELRYKVEKKIMNAVSRGLKEEALELMNLVQFNVTHRVPNNILRAQKNITFTLNTLLRIAAEYGGVSPVYIHGLSDKFAILIENSSNIKELIGLRMSMVLQYCDLVYKLSTAGYSKVIQNAINYINLNFDNKLSLSIIAEHLNANPSHLSRQFKKETKLTITEFIHKRMVDEAKFLIDQNNNSITDIALLVGFENHNYFCTVFKQVTSLTPRQYLIKSHGKT